MATIKFTLGDSEIWHVIELDYELSYNWVKDVDILAYIIKQEQDKCKNWRAKKVQDGNNIHDIMSRHRDESICRCNN